MDLLDIVKILPIYSIIVVAIGSIKFKEKIKRYVFIALSAIYNCVIGYFDTLIMIIIYAFFTNMPKGRNYYIPDDEAGINGMIGFVILVIYLIFLIPINIYMKKKGEINIKLYAILNIAATIIGIILYWIFLDKSKQLI